MGPHGRYLGVCGAAVVAVALGACSGSSSAGSCFPPSLSASTTQVRPGQEVVLTGRYFSDGCDDRGRGEPQPPSLDQPITWTQAGATRELGRVDADRTWGIRVSVQVPADATSGPAQLAVANSNPVQVQVRAG